MRTHYEPEEVQAEVLEIDGKEIEVDFLHYQTDADWDGYNECFVGCGAYEIQILNIKESFQGIYQAVEVPQEVRDRIIIELRELRD